MIKYEIFASYSHHDVKIVKPIIQLLKPSVNVFIDGDSIIPGLKWAVVIGNAIQDCRLMYVFWCMHSSMSAEVKKEYNQAISLDKNIVPVLIDNTPLPKKLKNYQWVDLKDLIGEHADNNKNSLSQKKHSHQKENNESIYEDSDAITLDEQDISNLNSIQIAANLLNTNIESRIKNEYIVSDFVKSKSDHFARYYLNKVENKIDILYPGKGFKIIELGDNVPRKGVNLIEIGDNAIVIGKHNTNNGYIISRKSDKIS